MIEIITTLKDFLALGRPPDPEKLKALLLRSRIKKDVKFRLAKGKVAEKDLRK